MSCAYQTSLSFSMYQSLLKLMSIEWVMLSNHLILSQRIKSIITLISLFNIYLTASCLSCGIWVSLVAVHKLLSSCDVQATVVAVPRLGSCSTWA